MDISAKITEIKYSPFLCKELNTFDMNNLEHALSKEATFILKLNNNNNLALSWWVSAKRTRSYPYTRVYDSLGFSGKKVTVIPIFKDEGQGGDRDFLQWDTVSLMSLLGVYVIISYYKEAVPSKRYTSKITNQRFDIRHLETEMKQLLSYQSDALHWNLSQIDKVGEIGSKAFESYREISAKLGIQMHSFASAEKRIEELLKGKNNFMEVSRMRAKKAQKRESITIQPKEHLTGEKCTITIKNYLGGYYFFTCDEVELHGKEVYLIEGKHTKTDNLPSLGDIKDGLLKMILFTNLRDVKINDEDYNATPILKLTTGKGFKLESIGESQTKILQLLGKEAEINKFKVLINNEFLV